MEGAGEATAPPKSTTKEVLQIVFISLTIHSRFQGHSWLYHFATYYGMNAVTKPTFLKHLSSTKFYP